MSGAYKTLKVSDVQVIPYTSNKSWHFDTSSYGVNGIEIFAGQNISNILIKTTDSSSLHQYVSKVLYNNIKQLYYSNYLSSSYISYSSSAENFEQTTISIKSGSYNRYYNGPIKYYPTSSGAAIRIISIPQSIYGDKILPGTFQLSGSDYDIQDDREGNLLETSGSLNPVGNIIYAHGLIIITNPSYLTFLPTYSNDIFSASIVPPQKIGAFKMAFKGEYIIYENEIQCTINEDEYNFTLNPSISSNSSGSLYGYATSSIFNPYFTTVGIYNEVNELLAVAKMSKPIPIPKNSNLSIKIRYDS